MWRAETDRKRVATWARTLSAARRVDDGAVSGLGAYGLISLDMGQVDDYRLQYYPDAGLLYDQQTSLWYGYPDGLEVLLNTLMENQAALGLGLVQQPHLW